MERGWVWQETFGTGTILRMIFELSVSMAITIMGILKKPNVSQDKYVEGIDHEEKRLRGLITIL